MSGIILTDAPTKRDAPLLTRCPDHPKVDPVVVNMAEDMGCPKCGRRLERAS